MSQERNDEHRPPHEQPGTERSGWHRSPVAIDGRNADEQIRVPGTDRPVAACASIPRLIPASWASRLREEALALRASASTREREGFVLTTEGRLLCALRNRYVGHGLVDKQVGQIPALVSALDRRLGAHVRWTHSSYLYYARDDFLGLHRDHVSCALTVLLWLSGPAGSLHVHPELHKLDEEGLLRTANETNGHPPGGLEVDIRRGPVLLPGHIVPHDRPPHPHDEELVLATFCFALAGGSGSR